MFNFGILGLNARNLLYIKKFNPSKTIRLADNKLETKIFLGERGIPVAQTYGFISTRKQLMDFNFQNLPKKEFIIKPNKGSRGRGVFNVKIISNDEKTKLGLKANLNYYGILGKIFTEKEFRTQLLDILYGKYSLSTGNDEILIEEKLIPGNSFVPFCRYGLADIRIIVFNLIPVATMVRTPTLISKGTSNIDQGGIGLGIDVGSGKIQSMQYKGQIFVDSFPGNYAEFYQKKITFWDDLLLFSSQVQYFVNMGYIGLDWVITPNGPVILEMNARAGLKIQNICMLPLQKRLEQISDLKVTDPEKGVEIAKSLFTKTKMNFSASSKIIFLSQKAKLLWENKNREVVVNVDLNKQKNYISFKLLNKILLNQNISLDFPDQEFKLSNIQFKKSEKLKKNHIILGRDILTDFVIKPIHKAYKIVNHFKNITIYEHEIEKLQSADDYLYNLAIKINLSQTLKPINYLEELDNFIIGHEHYNPKFKYRWPSERVLRNLGEDIDQFEDKYFHKKNSLKSKFAYLFQEKIQELRNKILLIKAYKKQDWDQILNLNEIIYEKIDPNNLDLATQYGSKIEDKYYNKLGSIITVGMLIKSIRQYLKEKKITGVDIILNAINNARISISTSNKKIKINILSKGIFREFEIKSILAHEIDVHVMRYLHGKKNGWQIFKHGTANYFREEEGLALFNSFQYLPDDLEKRGLYRNYYFVDQAQKLNFYQLVEAIKYLENKNTPSAFKKAYKLKKGVQDTSIINSGAVNFISKIYLDGYLKIKKWQEQGGDISKLMLGKIKISDLEYIGV